MKQRSTRRVQRLTLALVSLFLMVVLADVGARVLGVGARVYAPRRFEPDNRVPFVQIPRGPISYQPGARFASVYDMTGLEGGSEAGRIAYAINSFGFRGPEISQVRSDGVIRVACLGDSITFGEGVREGDCYPRRMEVLLNKDGGGKRFEVLNCGVQGHGTIDEYVYYSMYVSKFQPNIVTVGFFLNDAMDGAETIRRNEEWTKEWELTPLSRVSRISEIFERRRVAERLQDEYFASIRASFKSKRWSDSLRALGDLKRLVESNGGRLAVVIFPVLWGLDSNYPFENEHREIRQALSERGIKAFDLLESLRGRECSSLWVHPTDQHPNAVVQEIAASTLARWILSPE